MKALLDTNIVIAREAGKVVNQDIGILFKWLDKVKYEKCVHPITLVEIDKNPNKQTVNTFNIKLDSYELLRTTAPIAAQVAEISTKYDKNENDLNDTILLNEIFCDRVDILITEDKKIHQKASELSIADRVLKINSFLEQISSRYPELVDYKVLSVKQAFFGNLNIEDPFFDTLKEDYIGFEKWFNRKASERAYVTVNKQNSMLLSFLYLKREDESEVYADITPIFKPKRRLKVGTFKVVGNGVRLGERFLKIIFDNALANKVDEAYVTIFEKRPEQLRLIELIETWGFKRWGEKSNGEAVYVKPFYKDFDLANPKRTFPYISSKRRIFLVPIYPDYHTELFPDSILRTESPVDFEDNEPHRNAISKVYVSRSHDRSVERGDILIFYRTGGIYQGVVSTICIADEVVHSFQDEDDFVNTCKKRSVYSEQSLRNQWKYNSRNRPFLVSMLYTYSFPKRANLKTMIDSGVIASINDVPRGFKEITKNQFKTLLKITDTNENFIVD
ncbi:PIN domain-containing protein [Pedobacter sp. P351]|uniref:PIN domain-containing protein n=1 Tax=Pedobacter superstes TaxID=3133441 RepID=UPI0030AA016B